MKFQDIWGTSLKEAASMLIPSSIPLKSTASPNAPSMETSLPPTSTTPDLPLMYSRLSEKIEILKRLQREAFSDLMKLRDRQEKTERVLSLYKANNRSPFQDASTHVKGIIDVVGAWFFADTDGEQYLDMLSRTGIRTGVDSRFIFETTVRQKDVLTAELVANNMSIARDEDLTHRHLSLAKVTYLAYINDWLSVSTIPMGPQCRDFSGHEPSSHFYGPPLFNQYHSSAAAIKIKRSKLAGAIAGLVSGSHQHSDSASHFLASFGQCTYQPFEGTKITLSGLWQMPQSPFKRVKIGPLAIPVFGPKRTPSDTFKRHSSLRRPIDTIGGSIAIMLESELDDSTRIGGWIQKNHVDHVQWSVSLADLPVDELGWGLSVGGSAEHSRSQVHFEGFLNFNYGNRFNLQPGLVYALDGTRQKPVITLRTNWSL